MFTHRLSFYIFTLLIMLIFSGCGNSSAAQTSMAPLHPSTAVHTIATVPSKTVSMLGSSRAPQPVHLLIPAIGVNANVEPVEILPDGNLATPTNSPWKDVGWYDLGTHPGEQGSAVIDGHLDRPGGAPAVFWNLSNLHATDEVQIINTQGKTLHFRVTRVAFYTPQAAPIMDIFGNTGGKYLNLITCAGDWIPSQHQTTLRLVVYSTLMS